VLPLLRKALVQLAITLPCEVEFVLVNDGSADETLALLLDWASGDTRVKLLSLARNFGHQAASTAGLDHARGQAVVLMDGDLQDPPELIHEMLEKYCRGYDVVYAQRIARDGESFMKRSTAWLFYRLIRLLVNKDLPVDAGDYRMLSDSCLSALRKMRETHRFLRGMVAWVGFPQIAVQFRRPVRAAGETKYPISKMLSFAWNAALSFSPLPLKMTFAAGFLVAFLGLAYGCYAAVRVFLGLYVVPGWTSLMVALCLIGGSILMGLGLVGEYIAKIYEEIKGRPLYVVQEAVNLESWHSVGTSAMNRAYE
jgi:glycosyltransferase involved in cell wall biosynthesis